MTDILDAIQIVKSRRGETDTPKSSRLAPTTAQNPTPEASGFLPGVARVGASMMGEVSAAMQGTSPVTRDLSGKSTRPILGEYAPGDGLGYIQTPDGLIDFSPSKHTALLDDASGKVMVYKRTPSTDEGGIAGFGRVMSLGALGPVTRLASGVPGTPSTMTKNLNDFDRAQVRPPSLGTISEQRGTRIIEEAGRNFPLTAGQFQRADQRAISDTAAAVERTGAKYGGAQTSYDTGGAIRDGIDRYRVKLNEVGDSFFRPVHRAIGDDTNVDISSTKAFLKSESERFSEFPELGDFLNSPQLKQVQKALESSDSLPYELLKDLRTRIGKRMSSGKVVDDKEDDLLKNLYGVLSDDMRTAARAAGVEDKFDRANKFWQREMERVESLNKLYKKTNERIASDTNAMLKGGTSRSSYDDIKKLFGALKGDERKDVAAGVIRNMGLAKAGDEGSFSTTRFLSAFDKMDPKSRDLLFGSADNELRKELNGLIRVMRTLEKSDEVKQRPNTAVPLMGLATLAGVSGGIYLSLELTALASITGAAASVLMTSPKFIRLVRYATETGQRIPANRLALIARDGPGQADAIRQFQAALAEQQGTEPSKPQ